MRSFLLSYRLKQLSRDITKQTFSDTTERVDAEALKQAPEENFVWHSRCMCGHFTCWIHDSPANFGGKS